MLYGTEGKQSRMERQTKTGALSIRKITQVNSRLENPALICFFR